MHWKRNYEEGQIMSKWNYLFKTRGQRQALREAGRHQALGRAKTAVRRERRFLSKRQGKAEELRRKAVEHEGKGRPDLAKQMVRQFIQIDREVTARTMAVNNMEYTLEQVQIKDNYDEFARGMEMVASLEELAHESVDPDVVRTRLTELAQRNQDIVEPWTEGICVDAAQVSGEAALSPEEEEAYSQVITDAAGEISSSGSEFAKIDEELEQKMDAALAKE